MKKARLIISAFILAGALFSTHAYDGKNVNAKAVSVNWLRGTGCCGCDNGGSLLSNGNVVLYTIQNSKVTAADTIHNRSSGMGHYPAFNLSGTRVAFYRDSVGPKSGLWTGCQSANGGKSTISVIDLNTRQVTNLCNLPSSPTCGHVEEVPLDWPAGDWIYYERTHDPADVWEGWSSSIDIWRVNSVTKINEKVCNFSNNGQENICTYFRRFSLSSKGDRMAAQLMGKYDCSKTPDVSGVNGVYKFPGACNFSNPGDRLNYEDGCNIGISPSGQYVGSYIGGMHVDLFINNADGKNGTGPEVATINISNQLESWAGEAIGTGAEHIQWAVNSDKWVMQEIGYAADGHADGNADGSNQVVCNWTDKVAINISKNRNVSVNGGTLRMNNDAGDFFVIDPANNPQGTKYEDLQGTWHEVPGASPVIGFVAMPPEKNQSFDAVFSASSIRIQAPAGSPWQLAVAAPDGRILNSRRGESAKAEIPVPGLSEGVYLMTLTARGKTVSQRFLVR
jgi:hypothetical protein